MSNSRICISLSRKLLYNFENVINEKGYSSRSSGVQEALKNYIVQSELNNEIEGKQIGTIIVIYETQSEALEYINIIKKEYTMCINSSIQEEISNKESMDLIIVKGDINCINALKNKIIRLKEVEKVKLSITSINKYH